MLDIFSFLPTHTLPWANHSVCGFKYHPQCILSPLLQIHIFMPTWPTETIIGITNATYPNISSWYSNLHHPLLHLLLRLWQSHSSHCSGSKSWWYLWLPPPFFSLSTSDLPKKKSFHSYFQNMPRTQPLLTTPTATTLVQATIISCLNYCFSFPVIFLDSVIDLSCSVFNTAVRMILLKALWCFPCPTVRAQRAQHDPHIKPAFLADRAHFLSGSPFCCLKFKNISPFSHLPFSLPPSWRSNGTNLQEQALLTALPWLHDAEPHGTAAPTAGNSPGVRNILLC